MNKIGNVIWGLVLVFVGVIFALNALNIASINIFFDGWWTFFIIVPCFINLFKDKNKTGSIIGLVIGVALLLGAQDIIDYAIIWKLMIPFILIIIGFSIIFKDTISGKIKQEIKKMNKNDLKDYYATFASQDLNFANEKFTGGNLNAIFGGIKCDLRDAIIKEDVLIESSAIFGGITIIVPDDVNVKVNSTPIFGGVSDERKNKSKENTNKVTIYINALSMFGGVEIK